MTLQLTNPLLVGRSGDTAIIADEDFTANPNMNAQLWTPDEGYSAVRPLQVHLKFLYYIEDVIPPQPWQEVSSR